MDTVTLVWLVAIGGLVAGYLIGRAVVLEAIDNTLELTEAALSSAESRGADDQGTRILLAGALDGLQRLRGSRK
ncbi:MAG: hypothetical protein M3N28_08590 [Actinomycetota bacterium]|nr:hypothetical protein [Actinomycetota bacterium]